MRSPGNGAQGNGAQGNGGQGNGAQDPFAQGQDPFGQAAAQPAIVSRRPGRGRRPQGRVTSSPRSTARRWTPSTRSTS